MKPGNVSSAERTPPPTVGLASNTTTDLPACASVIAAASPLGPVPITTASYSRDLITYQSCARDEPGSRDKQPLTTVRRCHQLKAQFLPQQVRLNMVSSMLVSRLLINECLRYLIDDFDVLLNKT